MRSVRAGQLRHRVTIQAPPTAQNSFGEVEDRGDTGWTDVAEVWAKVEPMAGRERFDASRERSDQPYLVHIRRNPNFAVTAGMRVIWGGRTLEIDAPPIDIDGAGRILEIAAVEHG